MRTRRLVLCLSLLAAACSKKAPEQSAPLATRQAISPKQEHGLSWYIDAPEAAFAAAKQSGKLVLVDLWAPWCHTCLSMRQYVLTRENLASVAERLVLLAVNTERRENAPLLASLPIAAWPTFYLVDASRTIHGRWVGAASPAQLAGFVRDGLRAFDARAGGGLPAGDPLALLLEGDRRAAEGKLPEARDHYQRALAAAQADWSRRPDALVALASTIRKLDQRDLCIDLGLTAASQTGTSASATDFAYHVLECAAGADPHDPRVPRLRKQSEEKLAASCETGSPQLTPDDRGDACGLLRTLRLTLGDEAGARKATETRLAVLTKAAEGMPDAVALTYDFARMEALLALGRGEEALALLSARERALPDDPSPPHYLARTLRDLGRFGEGLAPVERALEKLDGPRRAAVLGLKVDLLLGAGKRDEARRTLEQQVAAYRALPKGQAQPGRAQAAVARLEAWE